MLQMTKKQENADDGYIVANWMPIKDVVEQLGISRQSVLAAIKRWETYRDDEPDNLVDKEGEYLIARKIAVGGASFWYVDPESVDSYKRRYSS